MLWAGSTFKSGDGYPVVVAVVGVGVGIAVGVVGIAVGVGVAVGVAVAVARRPGATGAQFSSRLLIRWADILPMRNGVSFRFLVRSRPFASVRSS